MIINNNVINISLDSGDIKALNKVYTLVGMIASTVDNDETLTDMTTGECVDGRELCRVRGIIDMIRNCSNKNYMKM